MCTFWNSLVVQWLRLCISTVEDTCSIPVWGTIRFYMLLSVAKKQNKCVPLTLLKVNGCDSINRNSPSV